MAGEQIAGALPGLAGASAGGGAGLGLMAVGMAAQGIAGYEESGYEKQIAGYQQDIAAQEQQANVVNFHQAKLNFQRNRLQEFRNAQSARSLALAANVGEGTQFGSALGGAYGQIAGEANTTMLGLNQNEALAGQMFAINSKISADKMGISKAQGQMATWQGIGAIGGGATSFGGAVASSSTRDG